MIEEDSLNSYGIGNKILISNNLDYSNKKNSFYQTTNIFISITFLLTSGPHQMYFFSLITISFTHSILNAIIFTPL